MDVWRPSTARQALAGLALNLLLVLSCGAVGWLYIDIPPRHQLLQLDGTPSWHRFHDEQAGIGGGPSSQLIFDLNAYRLSLGRWVDTIEGTQRAAEAIRRGDEVSVLASPQRMPWWSEELVVWELSSDAAPLVRYEDSTQKYRRDGWFILAAALLLSPGIPYLYYWHRRLRRQAMVPSDD